jgi:hypothetical protein
MVITMSRRFNNNLGDDIFMDLYGLMFYRPDNRYRKQMMKVRRIEGEKK